MSEVTTEDLRNMIAGIFNGELNDLYLSKARNAEQAIEATASSRDAFLAAFDALVEKAEKGELFEKLEKLREQHYYTAIHLKHERVEIRSRDAKYKLAVKSDAPTLAEALKAVPE